MLHAETNPNGDNPKALFTEDLTNFFEGLITENNIDRNTLHVDYRFTRGIEDALVTNLDGRLEEKVAARLRTELRSYYPELAEVQLEFAGGKLTFHSIELS